MNGVRKEAEKRKVQALLTSTSIIHKHSRKEQTKGNQKNTFHRGTRGTWVPKRVSSPSDRIHKSPFDIAPRFQIWIKFSVRAVQQVHHSGR